MASNIVIKSKSTETTFKFAEGVTAKQKKEAVATHKLAMQIAFGDGKNGFRAFEEATNFIIDNDRCLGAKCEVSLATGKIVAFVASDKTMTVFFKSNFSGKAENTTNLVDRVVEPIAVI